MRFLGQIALSILVVAVLAFGVRKHGSYVAGKLHARYDLLGGRNVKLYVPMGRYDATEIKALEARHGVYVLVRGGGCVSFGEWENYWTGYSETVSGVLGIPSAHASY